MHRLIIILLIIFWNYKAFTVNYLDPFLNNSCSASIPSKAEDKMAQFVTNYTNDLTKNLDPYLSAYDKAYIYGKVLDENCQPISDVKIIFWQSEIARNGSFTQASGTANSNNLGEFLFATYIPDQPNFFIKGKVLVFHDDYFSFLSDINLKKSDSLKQMKVKISSPWIFPNSDKYNQDYIYLSTIVIPTANKKIDF